MKAEPRSAVPKSLALLTIPATFIAVLPLFKEMIAKSIGFWRNAFGVCACACRCGCKCVAPRGSGCSVSQISIH